MNKKYAILLPFSVITIAIGSYLLGVCHTIDKYTNAPGCKPLYGQKIKALFFKPHYRAK